MDATSPAPRVEPPPVPAVPPSPGVPSPVPPGAPAPGYWDRLPPRFRTGARARKGRRTPERPCLNCGDTTVGNYCPTCGQRKVEVRVSLRAQVWEILGDELALSSALPRTLVGLLFRPGFLTKEYVQGRCVRYILPLRMYIVTSIVFFLTLSIVASPDRLGITARGSAEAAPAATAAPEAEGAPEGAAGAAADAEAAPERAVAAVPLGIAAQIPWENLRISLGPPPEAVPGWLRPLALRMKASEERLQAMPPREAAAEVFRGLEQNAPKAMFVLLPLFAGILKLLYVRRGRFYVEHAVFALHVHSMAYLLFLAMLLSPWMWLTPVLVPWIGFYVFLAMKRVYGQGIFKTALKFSLLGWSYGFLLMIGFALTMLLTALTV
jgi:hypothetical protein